MISQPLSPKQPQTIGIIGGGFAGLMAYSVLRFRGIPARNITVLSTDSAPEQSWKRFVSAIHQDTMRSESIAHFFPTDSPGLATVEAVRDWSLKPLIQSWFDRYRPSVATMITHAKTVAQLMGFYQSVQHAHIQSLQKDPTTGQITVFDTEGNSRGVFDHVIIAIGHGPLAIPPVVEHYQKTYPQDYRVQHAFAQMVPLHSNETVMVVGDGLTAGTLWANILNTGGSVIAVSRDGFSFGQALNTPRKYFSSRGISQYVRKTDEQRMHELKRATRGTIPLYGEWQPLFEKAMDEGRLVLVHGTLEFLGQKEEKIIAGIRWPNRPELFSVAADRLVAATGFVPVTQHPLIQTLVTQYGIPTVGPYLAVNDMAQLPGLSTSQNTVSVIGPAAAWAIPCADSLGGMKITAHRIAEAIVGKETWNAAELWQKTVTWIRLLTNNNV